MPDFRPEDRVDLIHEVLAASFEREARPMDSPRTAAGRRLLASSWGATTTSDEARLIRAIEDEAALLDDPALSEWRDAAAGYDRCRAVITAAIADIRGRHRPDSERTHLGWARRCVQCYLPWDQKGCPDALLANKLEEALGASADAADAIDVADSWPCGHWRFPPSERCECGATA